MAVKSIGFIPKDENVSRPVTLADFDICLGTDDTRNRLTSKAARGLAIELIKRADEIDAARLGDN